MEDGGVVKDIIYPRTRWEDLRVRLIDFFLSGVLAGAFGATIGHFLHRLIYP